MFEGKLDRMLGMTLVFIGGVFFVQASALLYVASNLLPGTKVASAILPAALSSISALSLYFAIFYVVAGALSLVTGLAIILNRGRAPDREKKAEQGNVQKAEATNFQPPSSTGWG